MRVGRGKERRRSWVNYLNSGCGILYPAKVTWLLCNKRERSRLPRVWSSLLNVNREDDGMPSTSLYSASHSLMRRRIGASIRDLRG